MDSQLKVLMVDASTGYYRTERYPVGPFFGPVDLGLHLTMRHGSLNFGVGLLAGSIFPGTNRLVFTGMSPCWHGFYISSMGGAGLVFDNLGLNMVAITGRAATPSILALSRNHGEEIRLEIAPVDLVRTWQRPPGGMYGVLEEALERFADRYSTDPRVLAVGPAAATTDFAAIGSAPISRGRLTPVDTWAGRGGFGSALLQRHGLAAIVYGGTVADEDFQDRKVADAWFLERYQKKVLAKDVEATVKYRFDPDFDTGGTFGVNFASVGGRVIGFNYRTIYMGEDERLDIHRRLIVDHYLRQFNEETIRTKSMKTCGEPCPAVCKKLRDEYKKDYEPYQTMGPLCGIFDQRAAEKLNRCADSLGFDAISAGGVIAWLMECLHTGALSPQDLGVDELPAFDGPAGFAVETDSMHNAELGVALLEGIAHAGGPVDLSLGARRWLRQLARSRGRAVRDGFVATSFGRGGWMVPNQYWTPGVLAPMAMMGKYYMHYGNEFLPPRELGRRCAQRLVGELLMDNAGLCRFHRRWGEEMLPEIIERLYGLADTFTAAIRTTAIRINCRNASMPWEGARNGDFVRTYLERRREVEGDRDHELDRWIDAFHADSGQAALDYWFAILRGIHESLQEETDQS